MSSDTTVPDSRFFRLLLKGYLLATVISALVLLVAVAILEHGDGGTWVALNSGLFVPIILILGAINLVVFPLAAFASWPFCGLIFRRPLIAFLIASACGIAVGAIASEIGLQGGPGNVWPGPLVGFVYALVWFLTVKLEGRRSEATID